MAFQQHLQWGRDIVFTFGPFGFVDDTFPFFALTTVVAIIYALAVTWGLAAMVVAALRPAWGLWGAGVVAWLVVGFSTSGAAGFSDVSTATALGLALIATLSDDPRRRAQASVLLGALAGFDLLVKFNDGLLATGLVVVVTVSGMTPRPRAALWAGTSLLGVFLVGWLATAQSLGNLGAYLQGTFSVTTGYSSAMGLSSGRQAEVLYALGVTICLFAIYHLALGRRPRGQKITVLVLLAGWTWAEIKEGFVRHDHHDLTYFGLALAAVALVGVGRRYIVLQAIAIAGTVLFACLAAAGVPAQVISPVEDLTGLAAQASAAIGLRSERGAQSALRARIVATGDKLPISVLAQLKGRTVAPEPIEDAIVFAYPNLRWDPEPVLQGYSAYTSYLDRLDASFLSSSRSPQRIVYQPNDVIDGRDQWMDPPATLEAMYCHYDQLSARGAVQVLARVPDRCGRVRLLTTVRAAYGHAIEVPSAPGKMVVARFYLSSTLADKVESLAFRPPPAFLTAWYGPGSDIRYRFITGTAPDLHVLSVPASLGYSAGFTPPPVEKLVLSGNGWASGQGHISVRFYALSVARS